MRDDTIYTLEDIGMPMMVYGNMPIERYELLMGDGVLWINHMSHISWEWWLPCYSSTTRELMPITEGMKMRTMAACKKFDNGAHYMQQNGVVYIVRTVVPKSQAIRAMQLHLQGKTHRFNFDRE